MWRHERPNWSRRTATTVSSSARMAGTHAHSTRSVGLSEFSIYECTVAARSQVRCAQTLQCLRRGNMCKSPASRQGIAGHRYASRAVMSRREELYRERRWDLRVDPVSRPHTMNESVLPERQTELMCWWIIFICFTSFLICPTSAKCCQWVWSE